MTRVVLSIGSNLGDRLARLQCAVDGLGASVRAVSPVYETDAWGGVEQGTFLNAVVVADNPQLDAHGWLRRAQALEQANGRIRGQMWGPRTLDVDLVCCHETSPLGDTEVIIADEQLTLPHPLAHVRAFVLIPWLAVEPGAEITAAGQLRPVELLLAEVEPSECAGVRPTAFALGLGTNGTSGA